MENLNSRAISFTVKISGTDYPDESANSGRCKLAWRTRGRGWRLRNLEIRQRQTPLAAALRTAVVPLIPSTANIPRQRDARGCRVSLRIAFRALLGALRCIRARSPRNLRETDKVDFTTCVDKQSELVLQ